VVKNIIYRADDKEDETAEVFFNNICLDMYHEFWYKNSK